MGRDCLNIFSQEMISLSLIFIRKDFSVTNLHEVKNFLHGCSWFLWTATTCLCSGKKKCSIFTFDFYFPFWTVSSTNEIIWFQIKFHLSSSRFQPLVQPLNGRSVVGKKLVGIRNLLHGLRLYGLNFNIIYIY